MELEWLLSYKAIMVGVFLALFVIYERVRPAVDHPLLVRFRGASAAAWRRVARNTGLFGINLIISPVIVVPITLWAEQFTIGLRPAWLSGWTGVAVDLIVLDFWIYWWHRANHEIPILWRFHQVHHFDELLDSTTAVRFHFGEVVLSALVRAVVIIAPRHSLELGLGVRGSGADVGDLPSQRRPAVTAARADARAGDHHAVDPLGPPSRGPG